MRHAPGNESEILQDLEPLGNHQPNLPKHLRWLRQPDPPSAQRLPTSEAEDDVRNAWAIPSSA